MLEFTCPFCGKRVQGDDSVAGQMLRCPGCQNSFTSRPITTTAIAEGESPSLARTDVAFSEGLPPRDETPSLRKSAAFAMPSILTILVILAIVSIVIALFVPATRRVRDASARTQSVNNLKQIGLAAQSFHDAHKRLPFNGTGPAAANDPTSGSWAFQLLPYVEEMPLFAQPNPNRDVRVYMCPGRGRANCVTGAWTDFMINPFLNDPDGKVDTPDSKLKLMDVHSKDGTSHTIFAGHGTISPSSYGLNVAHAQSTDIFKGGNGALARRATRNVRDSDDEPGIAWGSPYPQGTAMVMCDGTVRFFPYTMSGGVIRNGVADGGFAVFLTPNGAEKADLPD